VKWRFSANEVVEMEIREAPTGERGVQPAVLSAISSIQERYFEPITLAGLASEVYVSPFHFSRIFSKATGLSPGRFVSAVRLFEAKKLLLTTSLTVADIVCSVGYSSVGTFTSRFTRAVGMTPTGYRDPDVKDLLVALAPHLKRMPPLRLLREAGRNCAATRSGTGAITARFALPPGSTPGQVLIGVFADRVPQSCPVAFGGMANVRAGEVTINGVPDGEWTVIAIAEHGSAFSVGTVQSRVKVAPHGRAFVNLRLRAPRQTDPPIAITLATGASAPVSPSVSTRPVLRLAA
jgi:AraC family transcriptional regulator